MAQTGINLESVKTNNRSAVLRLLNARGAMSRKDIADELGLTPASVTQICGDMFSVDILHELGELKEDKRAGRKKILIGINYTVRYALAVSLEGSEACITICDLAGNRLAETRCPLCRKEGSREFLSRIAAACKTLLWDYNIPKNRVLGVGISVPGTVDRAGGICADPTGAGKNLPLAQLLEAELSLPVVMENNVKAFAEAGAMFGSSDSVNQNTLFVKWGPGVGAAIVVDGRIYEGHTSKAAELGHIRAKGSLRPCRCGRTGCLEAVASTHAIAATVRSACTRESMPALWAWAEGDVSRISTRTIEQWVQVEDAELWQVLDNIIYQMADAVCGAATLLAPDHVMVYGKVFALPHFMEHFLHYCKEYDITYDETLILRSGLSDKIDYIGPLAVVVNELFYSGRDLG